MGGVYQTSSSTGYSSTSATVLNKTSNLHKSLDPKRWKEDKLKLFAIDVTGSMGNWTKIVYDKLPMFYGQIMMQNYLKDPAISFSAVGDAYSDGAPIQIAEFGQGKQIDQLISKMYLEGGGGGQGKETYELNALFYARRLEFTNCEQPFCFFTGDENFYKTISTGHISSHLGLSVSNSVLAYEAFRELKKKFNNNVFLLHKPYYNSSDEKTIVKDWKKAIGDEYVIMMKNPKAVIDMALGVIAIVSGERSLEEYLDDMRKREQTSDRIAEIKAGLLPLSKICKTKKKEERNTRKIEATSYGIVPCKIEDGKCFMYVAQHSEGKHWDFVKGLPQKGEKDPKKIAERELKEETNFEVDKYLTDKVFTTSYKIKKWEGFEIDKQVKWYVALVKGEEKTQKEEVLDSKWVEMEKIKDVLTFDTGKELVDKVKPVIEESLYVLRQ